MRAEWPLNERSRLLEQFALLRRPEGGYGWESESEAHVTPTFAVVGCCRLTGAEVPASEQVTSFLTTRYPVPERRRKERPIWTFDFQQVQALTWLKSDTSMFRELAGSWNQPSVYTANYEAESNPVLQSQAMGVRTRVLLGIDSSQPAWREYFGARRRSDGTYK